MPVVKLSPILNTQVIKENGDPAVGWKIFSYTASSSTPLPTYTDESGNAAQTNPVIINSIGFPTSGEIWLAAGSTYKLILTDENDVPKKTFDDIRGVNDTTIGDESQWISSAIEPLFFDPSTFSILGDHISEFHVGRRVQLKQGVAFVYATIATATFNGSVSRIGLTMDAGQVLNNSLTVANLSLLRADHHALPKVSFEADVLSATTINLTGAFNQAAQVTLASAATVDLFAAASDSVLITGITTINSFGTAPAGVTRTVEFQSALTLTYNATSMQLPGSANIAVLAGDVLVAYSKGGGNWKVIEYTRFTTAPGAAGIASIQLLTASGNFIVPIGVSRTKVSVLAGGNPGSVVVSLDGNIYISGASGGAAIKVISGLVAGQSIPYVVGGVGQPSSFGGFCSASSGVGGIGAGGDINIRAAYGGQITLVGTSPAPLVSPGVSILGSNYGSGGFPSGFPSGPTPGVIVVEY